MAQDLRHALRAFARSPLFFAGAVLTLALGTGANAAVFSILSAVLLQPLPYTSPDRVVMLWRAYNRPTDWRSGTTSTGVVAWKDQSSDVLEDVASVKGWQGNLEASLDLAMADRTDRLRGSLVSPNFFEVLGVRAVKGRVFTTADETNGARDLVVLSYALWQRAFGGDAGIVGQTISLTPGRRAARPFTVVGVLPAAFRFTYPLETEVWALQPWADIRALPGGAIEFNGAVARLKPSVTLEQAQARLTDVGVPSAQAGWPESSRQHTRLEPIEQWVVGETRSSLWLLGGVAILLLVIACTTVTGLLLVRLTERQRELAVRTALGASQSQIVRFLLAEGVLLAVAGTVTGTLLSLAVQPVIRALVPPTVPRADEISVNVWTVVASVGIAVFCVLLVAIAPAWRARRFEIGGTLKRASTTTSADPSTAWWRRMLLAGQACVATGLLVAAALLIVSLWRLNHVPLGFDGDRVFTVEMRLLGSGFRSPESQIRFQQAVAERVAAVPGVVEVGFTSAVPFRGVDFIYRVDRADDPKRSTAANARFVDAGYFSIMRIAAVRGRLFDGTDTFESPKVMVVSEQFAREMFGDEDPIGRQILTGAGTTIVGVVTDLRYISRDKDAAAAIYMPRSQRPNELICLVARTAIDAPNIATAIRKAIYEVDPAVPTMSATTIDRIISESVSNRRFLSVTTAAFSVLALLLTVVGLGVLVARAIVERRREMAIRSALGATSGRLVGLLMWQGLLPIVAGATAGLGAAFLSASALAPFLYSIGPRNPILYAGVAAIVLVVAAPACFAPARRVVNLSPAQELRAE